MSVSLAHRRAQKAILLALIAYAFYSTGDALVKILSPLHGRGLIMTCNGLVICGLSLFFLSLKGQVSHLWQTPRLKLHLSRSVIVGSLVFMALTALAHIPLPDFYGILFMSPFVVGIFAHFLFGEEIGYHRMIAMAAGFTGVLILAGPTFEHPNIGYLVTFIMLFVVASHVLVVRKLGTDDPWPLLSFFPGLGMLMVGLPLLSVHPEWPHFDTIPLMIFYSLCIFCGQIAFSKAFTTTPLTAILAPYVYTQMLWGLVFSVTLFGHIPTWTTALGAIIIISSGIGNLLYERHLRRQHLLGARARQLSGRPEITAAPSAPSGPLTKG